MNTINHRSTTICINTQNLTQNVHNIRALAPTAKLLAMVKANAYGHGIEHIVPYIDADGFGVASLAEGLLVLDVCQKITKPAAIVLIEGVFSAEEWQIARAHDFAVVVKDEEQLKLACQDKPKPNSFAASIWLKYNTGMNRLGFDDEGVMHAARALIDCGYQIILTSHFACADDKNHPLNAKQIKRFDEMYRALCQEYGAKISASLCNSAGIMNFAQCHYDWVRAGIALYGSNPLYPQQPSTPLCSVMRFESQIMAVHLVCRGDTVGYGALWQADKDSVIGVVAAGYGDGYPRVITNGVVLVDGKQAPIVGRVAMDMFMVDLTDLTDEPSAKKSTAWLGKTVLLWGDELPCDEVAYRTNTISYELFCKTTARPWRVVV